MDILDAIFTRRSIRKYTEEAVAPSQIETILRAGMYAPSAHNCRAWEFLTVENKEKLQELSGLCRHWRMLREAPLAIVCCAPTADLDPRMRTYLIHNVSAAAQNMLLAAHALGLGAVWLNASPEREHYEPAKAALGLPADVDMIAVLAIGHPAAEQPERVLPERYEPQKWHKEAW